MDAHSLKSTDARRGSVMLAVLIFAIAVAGISLYAVNDTLNARQVQIREESYSDALAAAQYGAELALSEIDKGLVVRPDSQGRTGDLAIVESDFVLGADGKGDNTLYAKGGVTDQEQRRIRGYINNHEFRVRVRSARRGMDPAFGLTRDSTHTPNTETNKPLPYDWMEDPGAFAFGKDKRYAFMDRYEITATARPRNADVAEAQTEATVMTAVEYAYDSPLADLMTGATLMMEIPENFEILAGWSRKTDPDAPTFQYTGTATAMLRSATAYAAPAPAMNINPVQRLKLANSLAISGEDHDIRKQSIKRVVSERISTPLRLMTDEERFFNATGGYWTGGALTLNFIDINPKNSLDAGKKYKDVEITSREGNVASGAPYTRTVKMPVPNPHRPFNRNDPGKSDYYNAAAMNNLRDPSKPEQRLTANVAMWAEHNDGRTLDTYLLGGKKSSTAEYELLTTETELGVGYRHTVNSKSNPGYPKAAGVITSMTNSSENFTIVLGAFEDLPRLYINMADWSATHKTNPVFDNKPETWSQVYVGQYTNEARGTTMVASSAPTLMNIEVNKGKETIAAKIRPQTIHMLLDDADRMLVREYEYTFKTGKDKTQAVYFAYPASGTYYYFENLKTGEYAFTTDKKSKSPSNDKNTWGAMQTVDWEADEWKGNYTWAKATFPTTNKFTLDEATVAFTLKGATISGKSWDVKLEIIRKGADCVPRQFFWQELVGYSLEKDWSSTRYGEPMLVQDNLGFNNTGGTDPSSRRTIPYLDKDGNTLPVGFDEAYQRSPFYNPGHALFRSGNAGRWTLPKNNSKVNYPSYLTDQHDPIPVRNWEIARDGKGNITKIAFPEVPANKFTMNDFLYTKTFLVENDLDGDGVIEEKNEDGQNEKKTPTDREALCLFIAYEDQGEWTADYNYHDMIFSIYVAPAIEGTEEDILNIAAVSKQWWERDEEEGLSGKKANPAIGFNNHFVDGAPFVDRLYESYTQRFNVAPNNVDRSSSKVKTGPYASRIWTMQGFETMQEVDFPRAVFKRDATGKYNTGRLDGDDEGIKHFLDLCDETGKDKNFYYTKIDLIDYMRQFVDSNDPDAIAEWYDTETNTWQYAKAETAIKALNSGVTLLPIEKRFDDRFPNKKPRTERASLEFQYRWGLDEQEKLGINHKYYENAGGMTVFDKQRSTRELAGKIIGSAVQDMPIITTSHLHPVSGEVPEAGRLGFIAGELMLDSSAGYDMIADGIVSDGEGVPVRQDTLTFPEPDGHGGLRTGKVKAFLADAPHSMASQTAVDAAAKDAVALCYEDFYTDDQGTKQQVQQAYGIKEERSSIGFHRSGKEYNEDDPNAQDRMEIVALGVKSFNPFRLVKSGKEYIASEQYSDTQSVLMNYHTNPLITKDVHLSNPTADPVYAYPPVVDPEGVVVPNFVFDKPIDGAGALVVNGNLIVKSTFAYYGVLIVLGDLIIEPTLHEDEFVLNSEGHAVDMYGNAIYRSSPTANDWHYAPADAAALAAAGKPMMPTPKPALQDVYKGELIVQGTLAVKGRVRTMDKTVGTLADGTPDTRVGGLSVLWSATAVEDVGGIVSKGQTQMRRLYWASAQQGRVFGKYQYTNSTSLHDKLIGLESDIIPVENLWEDRTDYGNATYNLITFEDFNGGK